MADPTSLGVHRGREHRPGRSTTPTRGRPATPPPTPVLAATRPPAIDAPNLTPGERTELTRLGELVCRVDRQRPASRLLDLAAKRRPPLAYEGDRFVESMRYVRTYPDELPQLAELLPTITTQVTVINDRVVPVANAEFLNGRLPNSRLRVIDAGHFVWEEKPTEYAASIISSITRAARDRQRDRQRRLGSGR